MPMNPRLLRPKRAAAATPGVPTSLFVTAGNGQVSLSWTAPSNDGGAAITDYTVQYSTDIGGGTGSTWATFSRAASATANATVTGLTNGTSYKFRVAAVNSAGTGEYTSPNPIVTPLD
jgi:hypothetical protein